MAWLRQSTAAVISFGPFVDKGDGVAYEVGLVSALDHASTGIMLSKNGGALTIRHATVTATTYDARGHYLVTLDTTDTATLGRLRVEFSEPATCLSVWEDFQVLPPTIFDSFCTANAGAIPAYVAGAAGGLFIAGTNAATTVTTGLTTHLIGTVDTVTTLTGHTAQTGDCFARIGATGSGLTSLAPAATALTNATWTDAKAGYIDVAVSSRLAPTTAARTLDVTTGGCAGVDWANVEAPTSTVGLSGTTVGTTTALTGKTGFSLAADQSAVTVGTVTTVATTTAVTNVVSANVTQIGGVAQSATDLKDFADTGYDPSSHKVAGVVLTDLATACTTVATATAVTNVVSANVTQIGGVAQSATDLKDFADTGYDPSSHKVAGVVLTDTCTTATTATNLTNAPTNGDLTSTMKTSVQTAAAAANTAYDAATGTELAALDTALDAGFAAVATIDDVKTAILKNTSNPILADTNGYVTLAPVTHTGAVIPTVSSVTAVAAAGITATSLDNDAITAAKVAADVHTEAADVLLARDIGSGTLAGSTDERAVRAALRAIRNKWSISGTTYTATKEDDTTTAWTATLTTSGVAEPVTASDPTGP
jgi:hypothetical protein